MTTEWESDMKDIYERFMGREDKKKGICCSFKKESFSSEEIKELRKFLKDRGIGVRVLEVKKGSEDNLKYGVNRKFSIFKFRTG